MKHALLRCEVQWNNVLLYSAYVPIHARETDIDITQISIRACMISRYVM